MNSLPDYIDLVQRPSRYIGHEIGAIIKPPEEVDTRVALVFPDTYEIGISNLGLRILYHILNRVKGVQAERVYSPWVDLEEIMVKRNLPIVSMESNRPLKEFDIIGITLQYEMSYSNILNILKLSSIPLRSDEREEDMPLIIAGGPCAFNPEPLAQFFDAFVIGDGEEVVVEIVEVYRNWKKAVSKKLELLKALSTIEGVYVPYFFEVSYHSDGKIKNIKNVNIKGKDFVKKRTVKCLTIEDFPINPIIPYIEAVHDRVNIEVARGCLNGCRFCQAGVIYRPLRERNPDEVKELINLSIKNSGYKEVSLTSLNIGDYSGIETLVPQVMDFFEAKKISLSLPSLKPNSLHQDIASQIKRFRKTGFTIAPEAGSQRLRDVINKQLSEEEVLRAAEIVFKEGWGSLKLYFMIGFPTEGIEDIKEMVNLIKKIKKLSVKATGRFKKLSVSISPFVPKSHTPFQWVAQEILEGLNEKIRVIRENLKDRRIDIEWHNPYLSFLEACIARGDRKLGNVFEKALDCGCRFDGWGEHFNFMKWMRAFGEAGIDPNFYSTRNREEDEIFPWEHIRSGVRRDFLKREFMKALEGKITIDCRGGVCNSCGLESDRCSPASQVFHGDYTGRRERVLEKNRGENISKKTPFKFRIKFQKKGLSKYLSHLEFQNVLLRSLSRADIPVAYSKGFHPHPLISFSIPLPVGYEGLEEYFDIQLESEMNTEDFCQRVNEELPLGIKFLNAYKLQPEEKSLTKIISSLEYEIIGPKVIFFKNSDQKENIVDVNLVRGHRVYGMEDRDLKKFIKWIEIKENDGKLVKINYEIGFIDGYLIKPKDILKKVFGIDYAIQNEFAIIRKRVIIEEKEFIRSIQDI